MLDQTKPIGVVSTTVHPCWSCRGPVAADGLFCATCKMIQPPGQADHFARLGQGVRFDLDEAALDKAYFALQRQLHPDRFATRSPRERALSQQQATSLNQAYEVLKNPLKRADYLVHLKGTDVLPEGCNLVNDQDLLMEAMELREALLDATTPEDVDGLARRAADDIAACIADLSDAFRHERLEEACRLTTRLKYLSKLADETRARKAKLMSPR